MENYLKWNNDFRLENGLEKHNQHLQSKTNTTVEVYKFLPKKFSASC